MYNTRPNNEKVAREACEVASPKNKAVPDAESDEERVNDNQGRSENCNGPLFGPANFEKTENINTSPVKNLELNKVAESEPLGPNSSNVQEDSFQDSNRPMSFVDQTESTSEDVTISLIDISEEERESIPEKERNKKTSKKEKKKNKKRKLKIVESWEEQRWDFYKRRAEIMCEARETWNLGRKLGVIGREDEKNIVKRLEDAISKERKGNGSKTEKAKGSKKGKSK